MQKKYQDKGVILVALSYEPAGKVGPYVTKNKVSYIVGSDATSARDAYGVNGFPTAFLVDPSGKIAWIGHPAAAEEAIEDLLKESPPKGKGVLGDEAAKAALKKADNHLKRKRYGRAMQGYEKVAKEFAGTKSAKTAKAQIKKMKADPEIMTAIRTEEANRNARRWLDMARTLADNGAEKDAIRYLRKITEKYPESEHAATARKELARLEGGSGS